MTNFAKMKQPIRLGRASFAITEDQWREMGLKLDAFNKSIDAKNIFVAPKPPKKTPKKKPVKLGFDWIENTKLGFDWIKPKDL